jgi:ABC-type amino acid transport system permease subunit
VLCWRWLVRGCCQALLLCIQCDDVTNSSMVIERNRGRVCATPLMCQLLYIKFCLVTSVVLTLLRPTLLYGLRCTCAGL